MTKLPMAIRQENKIRITDKIVDRDPFVIGNVSGAVWVDSPSQLGKLDPLFRTLLACEVQLGPVYVVHSYGTPIGWVSVGNRWWTVPSVFYSRTSSGHQGILRQAIERAHGAIRS